jgi:hypothetical protein
MEAVQTSETSANFNVTTRRHIQEDSKLHTCRRENLILVLPDAVKVKIEVPNLLDLSSSSSVTLQSL